HLSAYGDFRGTNSDTARQQHLAFGRFASARDNVLARSGESIECDGVAFDAHMLDHHDGIGTLGDRSAGHDLNASARSNGTCWRISGFEFTDALQLCARDGISRADRKTVAERSIKGRIESIGTDFLCKNAFKSFAKWDDLATQIVGMGD